MSENLRYYCGDFLVVLLFYVIIFIMSKITRKEVEHLASLSAISLRDSEIEPIMQNLEEILGYFEELGELDTTGVEPTYQVTGLSNIWREDEVKPHLSREELLSLSPDVQNNSVKVPKVL